MTDLGLHLEPHTSGNRDNFFQLGNTAWDRHDHAEQDDPEWPTSLKGMKPKDVRYWNQKRMDWLLANSKLVFTPHMEIAHNQLRKSLLLRGEQSPECFGLRGERFVGKTSIIERYVYDYHCKMTGERPNDNGEDIPHVPVVWLQTSKTTKQIAESLFEFYGYQPPKGNEGTLIREARRHARLHRTEIMVLDDVHNLKGKNSAMDLKNLYENLGSVMFIFTRTHAQCDAFDTKTGGYQTLDRTVWQRIDPPEVSEDEWAELVGTFEWSMPWFHTNEEGLLLDHADLVHEITEGRTGKLAFLMKHLTFELVERSRGGEDEITADLLKSINMTGVDHDVRYA